MKKKAVFIDRDGTIGGGDQVILPGHFQLFPGVQASIDQLKCTYPYVCAFTNQPGISRGEAPIEAFERELAGFGFDRAYICPHAPAQGCTCRKPATGLLLRAAEELQLDLSQCVVIGDRWTDMLAAHEAGCLKILVKTGSGTNDLEKWQRQAYHGSWADVTPEYIADDLNDAVAWLLK